MTNTLSNIIATRTKLGRQAQLRTQLAVTRPVAVNPPCVAWLLRLSAG